MKVALTGQNGTIGKSIGESLARAGHEVLGISRATGYDLMNGKDLMRAVEVITPCEMFVNCAHVGYQQANLTQHVGLAWKNSASKRIILFSSTAVHSLRPDHPFYTSQKGAAETVAMNIHNSQEAPKMTIIRFGTVDVPERPDLKGPKMKPHDLVNTFEFVLSQSPTCAIFEITLSHPDLRFNLI